MNTKKYFITLFSFIIFSIYFTLSGVFVPFIASIPQSNGGFKTLSSQNDFYKMVDNFYDPDEFYNFRTDNQNINILANFYIIKIKAFWLSCNAFIFIVGDWLLSINSSEL